MATPVLGQFEIDKLFGIPAHPLIVHIPVVLVPLAAVGAVLALVVPRWRHWALPVTAALSGIALVGVQLAIGSGESLASKTKETAAIERHSELADQARPFVFVFFLVAVAASYLWWRSQRETGADVEDRSRTRPLAVRALAPVCALSVLSGALATTWVVRTGHSGAESVWKDKEKDQGADNGPGGTNTTRDAGDGDGD